MPLGNGEVGVLALQSMLLQHVGDDVTVFDPE